MSLNIYLPLIVFVSIAMAVIDNHMGDLDQLSNPKIGPKGVSYNKTTSCREFEKNARFNPLSVVGAQWFVFFYWAPPRRLSIYDFWIPTKKDKKFLHIVLDGHLPAHFNWSSNLVLMKESHTNSTVLLEEKGDRGQYNVYTIFRGMPNGTTTLFMNVRLKQVDNGKYLGLMYCKAKTVLMMSRINEVPSQRNLQDEAAKLGIRTRRGKSYLYQGSEWMPTADMHENVYWRKNKSKQSLK